MNEIVFTKEYQSYKKHLSVLKMINPCLTNECFSIVYLNLSKSNFMKKIFAAIMSLMLLTSMSFAQAKQDAKAAKPATSHVKKDGTPDKRFKENKDAATTAKTTHVKKDGTPDKRFKENKDAKKPATTPKKS